MATYSNSRIQLRIDTEANWQNNHPTIEAGEICLSSDKKDFVVGTGTPWAQGNYWIANNPTVISIRTTANNANNAASQAMNKANQALSTAQAAAQSAGRVVNLEWFNEQLEGGSTLGITEETLKVLMNNDVIGYDIPLDQVSFDINISNLENEANDVRFYFTTSSSTEIKGSFVNASSGSGLILIGNKDAFNGTDTVTIPANSSVEIRIIDSRIFMYNYTEWV